MDVDLRKFPLIPYNTTQAGIGGDLRKFLFARPPRTACGFAKWERKFLSIPFARHNTGDFSKCQKWAQKNRKPFLDFLSWCAVPCSGGYSVSIQAGFNLPQCCSFSQLQQVIIFPVCNLQTNQFVGCISSHNQRLCFANFFCFFTALCF